MVSHHATHVLNRAALTYRGMAPDEHSRHDGYTRRETLAGALGVLSVTAGCTELGEDPAATPTPDSEPDTGATPSTRERTRPRERPAEERFVETYRETIDSVVQIRTFDSTGPISRGTGFVYGDAELITNHHVVANATQVHVQYRQGEYETATVLGEDRLSDLAALQVTSRPSYATPLEFVDDEPPVGTEVVALGTPFGLEESLSAGVISGQRRLLPAPNDVRIPSAVQTDAAVNPGNSGGPLLTLDGAVVGVVTAAGGRNIAFVVSSSLVRRVVPSLIEDGTYAHPLLGVEMTSLTPPIATLNGIDTTRGVLVVDVDPDGPAGGILQGSRRVRREGTIMPVGGDVIQGVDGIETSSEAALATYLATETTPEETVALTVRRDDRERTISVTLGRREGTSW